MQFHYGKNGEIKPCRAKHHCSLPPVSEEDLAAWRESQRTSKGVNNETYGMTFEKVLCDYFNIENGISPSRTLPSDHLFVAQLHELLNGLSEETKTLLRGAVYCGDKEVYDLRNGDFTIQLKTNKRNQVKIAPDSIGQLTLSSFNRKMQVDCEDKAAVLDWLVTPPGQAYYQEVYQHLNEHLTIVVYDCTGTPKLLEVPPGSFSPNIEKTVKRNLSSTSVNTVLYNMVTEKSHYTDGIITRVSFKRKFIDLLLGNENENSLLGDKE